MELNVTVVKDADIVTNVEAVSAHYLEALKKYEGCVSSPETLKDDKKACAAIRKLKKMVSDERIAFDRRVAALECVRRVHDSLKAIEKRCDEIVDPYWKSVKAVEEAMSAPAAEVAFSYLIEVRAPAKAIDKICADIAKRGGEVVSVKAS